MSIPHFEVPATEVPGAFDGDRPVLKDIASKHLLDMYEIAQRVEDGDSAKIDASAIGLIVDDYAAWIEEQKAIAQTEGFFFFKKSAEINLKRCEGILARLREGVKTLKNDTLIPDFSGIRVQGLRGKDNIGAEIQFTTRLYAEGRISLGLLLQPFFCIEELW